MRDPALPVMTMDILSNVLERADHPSDLSACLAEEIRALTGVRCVVFVQYDDALATGGDRLISVNPQRRQRWQGLEGNDAMRQAQEPHPPAGLVFVQQDQPRLRVHRQVMKAAITASPRSWSGLPHTCTDST